MFYPPQRKKSGWHVWLVAVLLVVGVIAPAGLLVHTMWGAATLRYEWTPDQLVITFGAKVTRLDRADIINIAVIEQPTQGRRHMGSNMPGLKEGRWSFAETGRITLYSTSTANLTVIETEDGKWGISPEEREAFAEAWQSGQTGTFDPLPSDLGGGPAFAFVILFLVLAGTAWLFVYMNRLKRRLAYELADDAVCIYGKGKPIRIPYADITQLRVDSPSGRPWRNMGVDVPGLYWGSFSWQAAGGQLRLHASQLRPLVLLTTRSATYGISPEDIDGFVAALQPRIAGDDK